MNRTARLRAVLDLGEQLPIPPQIALPLPAGEVVVHPVVARHRRVEQVARPGPGLLRGEQVGRTPLVQSPERGRALGGVVVAPQVVGLGDEAERRGHEISLWSAGRAGAMSWL